MKRWSAMLLVLLTLCSLWGCGGETYPAPPSQEQVRQALLDWAEPQLQEARQKWNLPDLTLDIQFKKFEMHPADEYSDGWVYFSVRDRLVSPRLEDMLQQKTLPRQLLRELSTFSVDYEGASTGGYEFIGSSVFLYPVLLTGAGEEYTLGGDVILKGNTVVYVADDAQLDIEVQEGDDVGQVIDEYIDSAVPAKPYVGMDVSKIDSTELGVHDKTNYNYQKDVDGTEHRCTLYYWMEGSRCVFIARVQDDTGKVINVEENPAGSYFGN